MKKTIKIIIWTLVLSTNAFLYAQELHPAEVNKEARADVIGFRTKLSFHNKLDFDLKIFWLNEKGERVFLRVLKPNETFDTTTNIGIPFVVTDPENNALAIYYPDAQPRLIVLTEEEFSSENREVNTDPVRICADQEIPRGFLVVSVGESVNCPNWSIGKKNTYTIRRPHPSEITQICSGQRIPRGFVIVSTGNSTSCPNWSIGEKNTLKIKRPAETERICSVSEIPRGYVVTSTGNSVNCPDWSPGSSNTKLIKRIR